MRITVSLHTSAYAQTHDDDGSAADKMRRTKGRLAPPRPPRLTAVALRRKIEHAAVDPRTMQIH